jgi:hypothetical protein
VGIRHAGLPGLRAAAARLGPSFLLADAGRAVSGTELAAVTLNLEDGRELRCRNASGRQGSDCTVMFG